MSDSGKSATLAIPLSHDADELDYRGLFEHMNEGVAYCKMLFRNEEPVDHVVLAVSRRFVALTGIEDIVGRKASEAIPNLRQIAPGLLESYARVVETGVPEKFETYAPVLKRWFSVSVYSPCKNHFVVMLDNITERKRLEETLRQSEERLRLVVETTGLGTFEFDPETGTRNWSDAAKSFIGLPPAAVVDEPALRKALPSGEYDRVRKAIARALYDGPGRFHVEFRTAAQSADGNPRWIAAWGRALFDSGNRPQGVIGVMADISERKRIEEALRRREHEVSTVLDNTPDLVMRLDRQFRYTYVNAKTTAVAGIPAESFIGKTPSEVGLPQNLIDLWTQAGLRVFVTGRPEAIEFSYPSPGEPTLWEELFIPEPAPDGSVESIIIIGHDVTGRKRLERALESSRDEIRALAAKLMTAQEEQQRKASYELHEQLCQDLAALVIDTGGIEDEPIGSKRLSARLEGLRTRLVKALGEARQIAYDLHPVTLDDLGLVLSLRALCDGFARKSDRMSVKFESHAVAHAIPRDVSSCLYRVAQEGLENIAKHASARNVWVTLSAGARDVTLTIADDGAGFDAVSVKGRGGLGLVGLEERVRLVNGKLSIDSQPGRGTRLAALCYLDI